jgi:hypothetical protein
MQLRGYRANEECLPFTINDEIVPTLTGERI